MKNTLSSAHLDLLRTIAAWQVCVHHLKNLFFIDYPQVQSKNFFTQSFYYFSRFGHQSVIIFFVLSGLFVGSSVIKQSNEGKWSWSKYLIARLSRLYIVLVPALLIGGFWDWLGISSFEPQSIYDGKTLVQTVISFPVAERLNVFGFIGNLSFLQAFKVSPFGSNGSLWSLSYEFWYYILFPLIFLVLIKKQLIINRIFYSACFIILTNFIGLPISLSFLIWLLGVAIIYINEALKIDRNHRNIITFISFLVLILSISSTLLFQGFSFVSDLIVGVCASMFIFSLVQYDTLIDQNHIYPKTVHFLANFSYTLYLLHLPFLVFINALIVKEVRWQPDMLHIFIAIILFIITILYSYIISSFTEAKTNVFRAWLVSRLSLKS